MKKTGKTKQVVVAEGEATGHFHAVRGVDVEYKQGKLFAPEGGEITHQEHGKFQIDAGKHVVTGVVEYDPIMEATRRVMD